MKTIYSIGIFLFTGIFFVKKTYAQHHIKFTENKDSITVTSILSKKDLLYTSHLITNLDIYRNSQKLNFTFASPYFIKNTFSFQMNFAISNLDNHINNAFGLGLRTKLKDWIFIKNNSFSFIRLFLDNNWNIHLITSKKNLQQTIISTHQFEHNMGVEFGDPISRGSVFLKVGIISVNTNEKASIGEIYQSASLNFSAGLILYNSFLWDMIDFWSAF